MTVEVPFTNLATMPHSSKLAAARRERLLKAMAEDGTEAVVLYGNAWQS